jgi:hypothetical protein
MRQRIWTAHECALLLSFALDIRPSAWIMRTSQIYFLGLAMFVRRSHLMWAEAALRFAGLRACKHGAVLG